MTQTKYELAGAALCVGVVVFIITAGSYSLGMAAAIALLCMVVYLAGARASVAVYAVLGRWAYKQPGPELKRGERSLMVILWPACLPIAALLYPVLGIVNRAAGAKFRSSRFAATGSV